MSIRVQCGGCGSVMNVRDEYAGTERRCPKCKEKFQVPAGSGGGSGSSGEAPSAAGDDFDPVAFLTGEKPMPGGKAAPPRTSAPATKDKADFDPMDVLAGGTPKATTGGTPAAKAKSPSPPAGATNPPAAAPAPKPEFDPLDVLATPAKPPEAPAAVKAPPAPTASAAPPTTAPAAATPPTGSPPEKPQPRRPSWAKPLPEPEKNDWEPAAAAPPPPTAPPAPAEPEKPQPRRPPWAKPLPEPEKADWVDPPQGQAAPAADSPTATPEAPRPKRPSWAKPLPGEQPQSAAAATSVAADASPAAQAAAAAMGASIAAVSTDNPALQEAPPRRPWIDPAAIVAAVKRRIPLMLKTIAAAVVLSGLSWWFIQPWRVVWTPIGSSQKLELVPVTGRLSVDGRPIAGARVVFHPRGQQFRSPEAMTGTDGEFRLEFCEGHVGAPAGRYRVQLQLIGKDGTDSGVAADDFLRDKSFQIPEGGGQVEIAIDTKSKPPA